MSLTVTGRPKGKNKERKEHQEKCEQMKWCVITKAVKIKCLTLTFHLSSLNLVQEIKEMKTTVRLVLVMKAGRDVWFGFTKRNSEGKAERNNNSRKFFCCSHFCPISALFLSFLLVKLNQTLLKHQHHYYKCYPFGGYLNIFYERCHISAVFIIFLLVHCPMMQLLQWYDDKCASRNGSLFYCLMCSKYTRQNYTLSISWCWLATCIAISSFSIQHNMLLYLLICPKYFVQVFTFCYFCISQHFFTRTYFLSLNYFFIFCTFIFKDEKKKDIQGKNL